ncbi:MscS family membrane protein [Litorivivens lipolytica]|uniref:MscS family membrane protein n=1 Tax=Litorivivens lipolytica TaxID=1524264 RepID=A0A7W4W370_9GAMM|nr:mechanosensitive ion channel family protein [Litorivivens lipolytica]MBB3046485.1 MscS family membrane protein [Litorivivens lipolytica]
MIEEWLQKLPGGDYPWLWKVFMAVLATAIVNYLVGRALNRLQVHLEKTHNVWDDAVLASVRRPAYWMIWLVGFSYALQLILQTSEAEIFTLLNSLRSVMAVLILTWFLVGLVREVEQRLLSGEYTRSDQPFDPTTVMALGKLVKTAIIITALLVVMQSLGYSITGVLAFGGVGGIAVGFAAKDLLANFFGGLMVYLDRPFAVGDWIRSPDKNIEGTVENIGWRQTRIRTFDQRPLYVPNATFTQISVENPSRMLNRRIYETIGLRYDDARQLRSIVDEVRSYLEQHDEIDQGKTLIVNFNSFGASSLDFFIYTFTKTTKWVEYHAIKQSILLDILEIIHKHEADVAYPTSTIKLQQETAQQIEQQAANGREGASESKSKAGSAKQDADENSHKEAE